MTISNTGWKTIWWLGARRTNQGSRKAFTLIELLAVIAILGVLFAILLPVVGRIREKANAVKCLSNMRQQHAGAMLFVSDNKGFLPRAVDSGTYWFREIGPYLGYDPTKTGKDYSLFMCPERPLERLEEIVAEQGGSISYGGYLTNPMVCGIPPNNLPIKKLVQLSEPSKTWMIADGNGQAAAYIWSEATIEQRIAFDHEIDGQMKTHLIMLDGHATSKTVEEMIANEGNFWLDPRIVD